MVSWPRSRTRHPSTGSGRRPAPAGRPHARGSRRHPATAAGQNRQQREGEAHREHHHRQPRTNRRPHRQACTELAEVNEPRDDGEDTKATSPEAAPKRTKASDRRRNRPTSDGHDPSLRSGPPAPEQDGHEQDPPAHQDTDAPEAAARDTSPKAEARQKPRPEGPPTANTDSRAPEAQPTATPRPPRTTEATMRVTNDAAEAGSAREPQNPTKPEAEDTAHPRKKTRMPERALSETKGRGPAPRRGRQRSPQPPPSLPRACRRDIAGRSPTPE